MNAIKATTTLREFWNDSEVTSIFVAGTACPAGIEYSHNTDADGEDYCDLWELVGQLSPHCDLWELNGRVDGSSWSWDGVGNPRDIRGNSYTKIVARAEMGHEHADFGDLHDYASGEYIRHATLAERDASRAAGPEGVILVQGRSCYVQE